MWHPTVELWQAEGQPEGFVFAVARVSFQEGQANPACGCLQSAQGRDGSMARDDLDQLYFVCVRD